MGRQESVAQLERRLTYARNKAKYKAPEPEINTTPEPRPTETYGYLSLHPLGGGQTYNINVSAAAVDFFNGQASLGLLDEGANPPPPRGWAPSKIIARIGATKPVRTRAKASKRVYNKYTPSGEQQASFTAAIGAATIAGLDDKYKTIANSIKTKLKSSYGSTTFKFEEISVRIDGEAPAEPAP